MHLNLCVGGRMRSVSVGGWLCGEAVCTLWMVCVPLDSATTESLANEGGSQCPTRDLLPHTAGDPKGTKGSSSLAPGFSSPAPG